MIKEYKVNHGILGKFRRSMHKKHSKWMKKKKVLWILFVVPLLITLWIYIIFNTNEELKGIGFKEYNSEPETYDVIAVALMASLSCYVITLLPWIIYYKTLRSECRDLECFYYREGLYLTDDSIKRGFTARDAMPQQYYTSEIKYADITRLVVNEYYPKLNVYGKGIETYYMNYELNKTERIRIIEGRFKFYLYYEEYEDFIKTLSEITGLTVEYINCPETENINTYQLLKSLGKDCVEIKTYKE